MNIKLKSEILESSIQIENFLSIIIRTLLSIDDKETKTLGHLGSALSLKNKADLLYDINQISKNLYNSLLTFMEIRNQFIHNPDTNSFEFVVEKRIGKKKIFLDYVDKVDFPIQDLEDKYNLGFKKLVIELLESLEATFTNIAKERSEILQNKIDLIKSKQVAELNEFYLQAISDSIDEATNQLDLTLEKSINYEGGIGRSVKFAIMGILNKKLSDYDKEKINKS